MTDLLCTPPTPLLPPTNSVPTPAPWKDTVTDQHYDEARTFARDLGGHLTQAILQRRLRLRLQDATAILDRLAHDGHIVAEAREADRRHNLARALHSYTQALTGCAHYETAGHGAACRSTDGPATTTHARSPPMPAPQP